MANALPFCLFPQNEFIVLTGGAAVQDTLTYTRRRTTGIIVVNSKETVRL